MKIAQRTALLLKIPLLASIGALLSLHCAGSGTQSGDVPQDTTAVNLMPRAIVRYTPSQLDTLFAAGSYPEDAYVDTAPRPTKMVEPSYPSPALISRTEGTVWCKVLISKDGIVLAPHVARSEAWPARNPALRTNAFVEDFCSSSLVAVRQWKFKPAILEGQAVAKWVVIPFRFNVNR